MGGGKVKRRKYLEVWAWKNTEEGGLVELCRLRPERGSYENWYHDHSVGICREVVEFLSGEAFIPGADPIRVRIPPWTVLKGQG